MLEVADATFADFPEEVARRFPEASIDLHRSGTGIRVRFPSGWTMSVQTGPGMYNSHRFYEDFETVRSLWRVDGETPEGQRYRATTTTAEIAVSIGDGPLLPLEHDEPVAGWVTRADVMDLLGLLATLPTDLTPMKVNWQLRPQQRAIADAEYRELEPS